MLITFIGMQIPQITLICYRLLASQITIKIFWIMLVNAIATAITLLALYNLLSSILVTSNIFNQYLAKEKINRLSWNFDSEVSTLITDRDEALQHLDDLIQGLTNYDLLTGLPNREFFKTNLQQTISQTEIGQQFAIIVLALDNLKNINSTLGRKTGDLLLVNIAQRLTSHLASGDILARFGGDDFVILRPNIINHDSLIALSHRLLDSFAESFCCDEQKVSCTAKIGITLYPLDGTTVEQLLQNADTAIYQTQQQSFNAYQFYCPTMSGELIRTLALKENLRYALERNELYLHYQPRMEIATGHLTGVEALLRWDSPELGLVPPAEFIPIAEATNMIIPIGEWVLRNACIQNKCWQQLGIASLKISVNLSTCQFQQANLLETIDCILEDTDLERNCLELEITESLLVRDLERTVQLLEQLKQRGILIALDDFGTGYSSLSYLQKLPIDTLKIDRSFVTNIASNPNDAAISQAIVALAKSLKLNIIAEGVETEEQFVYLQNQGCHEVQGNYFCKPFSPEVIEDFLADYSLKSINLRENCF